MSSGSFDVQVAHHVEEIGPEAWDRLAGGRPFASYRWYRFAEAVLGDGRPIYITLSRGGEPAARATFWLELQEALPIGSRAARRLADGVLRRWPLMVCRAPLSSASGLILPDPPWRQAALETLIRVAGEQARRHRASFVIFDYLDADEVGWVEWPAAFTPVAIAEPGTSLAITWRDFESYVQHLSKGARKDYRRHCNRAADLGIAVSQHERVTTPVQEAMRLIGNVAAHHRGRVNAWAARALTCATLVDAAWLTAEVNGGLAGCGLLLGDGDVLALALLGLNYDVQYVYFQLMYAAVRCAIERGARRLRGGSGAYEIKERLGFQVESNHHVRFTSASPALRRLGRALAASAGQVR